MSPGEAMANRAQLTKAISEAPTDKAKALLEKAGSFLGMNERSNNAELKSFL